MPCIGSPSSIQALAFPQAPSVFARPARIAIGLRIDSQLTIRTSVGADVYKSDRLNMRFQPDGDNLNDRLNVMTLADSSPATLSAPRVASICDLLRFSRQPAHAGP